MLLFYFFCAFFLSFFLTPVLVYLMKRFGVIDQAKKEKRKIHKKNIPLGGGVAIFVAFFSLVFFAFSTGNLGKEISFYKIFGIFFGGLILMIGGFLDDKYRLRPIQQIFFPILASIVAISFGIGLQNITNPWGGLISLEQWKLSLVGLGDWLILADTVTFFWLMGMMFTTKLLDGMDGLATGIVLIGVLMIFFLSQNAEWFQPEVSVLSILFAGSCFGFLVWNFHPAKMFLGEGGSLFLGYMLAVLAIISGSKIATTLLVMGIPMLDVARVIIRRWQKKKPVFVGDSEHLHFRLLHSGLGQRQTVFLFYSIAFIFGISTLFLQTKQKLVALCLLLILMILIAIWFTKKDGKNNK